MIRRRFPLRQLHPRRWQRRFRLRQSSSTRSRRRQFGIPTLEALISELEELAPVPSSSDAGYLGFAVPLRRRSDTGELHLLTTLTYFGTAVTVTERRLGAFLLVDGATASILGELERLYSDAERGFSFREGSAKRKVMVSSWETETTN